MATGVASVIEGAHLISDLVSEEDVRDEIVAIGQYGALGLSSYFVFNKLQRHFARKQETMRYSA